MFWWNPKPIKTIISQIEKKKQNFIDFIVEPKFLNIYIRLVSNDVYFIIIRYSKHKKVFKEILGFIQV